MLNRVVLIGRLTHDPELRYTGSGIPVANFSLAVDRPFTNQQGEREADFIRIVVWRKIAEVCANNLGKGRLVAVEGRIQVRSYENKEGQRRQAFEVVGENVKFLDRPKNQGGKPSGSGDSSSDFPLDDDLDIGEDDLPF